jgi:hypothetical protein
MSDQEKRRTGPRLIDETGNRHGWLVVIDRENARLRKRLAER